MIDTSLVKEEVDREALLLVIAEADALAPDVKAMVAVVVVAVVAVVMAVVDVIKRVVREDAAAIPEERRRKRSWMPRWRTISEVVRPLQPPPTAHPPPSRLQRLRLLEPLLTALMILI